MAFTTTIFRGAGNAGDGGVDLPIRKMLMWAVVVAIAIIVVSVAGCGIKVVDTGQRGVKTRFGEITSDSLPEGLYFFNPITSKIIEIDTRVKRRMARPSRTRATCSRRTSSTRSTTACSRTRRTPCIATSAPTGSSG